MSMEFWGEKPATVSGMLLQDDSDNLSQVESADILAQLPSLDGMEILELAAGIGRYTPHFAQVASHVTAVDFVERFLDQNRKATAQFSNVSYYRADVMDLAFESESFDFVFINWLFMYLDDQQMVLLRDRIRQWTRVGGFVFFRESCFVGASGGIPSKDNPTRYRPESQYTRLFEDDFGLLHRGNVKVYEERFNRPNQCYWLFQRVHDESKGKEERMTLGNGSDQATMEYTLKYNPPMDLAEGERILKETKQFLEGLGVVFLLSSGSCLGATRDNAFIPWDDDIDLVSVFGVNGLTVESVDAVLAALRDRGCYVRKNSGPNAKGYSNSIIKDYVRIDWMCVHIIDDII